MAKLIVPIDSHTVYVLSHPQCSSVYYGVTRQALEDRFAHHMQALQRGYHGNHSLQRAFDALPFGWTVHQIDKLPHPDAERLEGELVAGDEECFNVQKNPHKVRVVFRQIDRTKVAEIEGLLKASGMYQYQIAKVAGVSMAEVSQISRGVHALQGVAA